MKFRNITIKLKNGEVHSFNDVEKFHTAIHLIYVEDKTYRWEDIKNIEVIPYE